MKKINNNNSENGLHERLVPIRASKPNIDQTCSSFHVLLVVSVQKYMYKNARCLLASIIVEIIGMVRNVLEIYLKCSIYV